MQTACSTGTPQPARQEEPLKRHPQRLAKVVSVWLVSFVAGCCMLAVTSQSGCSAGGAEPGTAASVEPAKQAKDPNIYWVDPESNVDQVNHVKYHGMYNENTMIIGFEDLPGGGDRDYNDLVIAVELTAP